MFETSSALASAYGIAVTGTMVVDHLPGLHRRLEGLALAVCRWRRWSSPRSCSRRHLLGANLLKVLDGGWVPLLIAGGIVLAMWTWVRGIGVIFHKTHTGMPLLELIKHLEKKPPHRVPSTAIFLTSDADIVPDRAAAQPQAQQGAARAQRGHERAHRPRSRASTTPTGSGSSACRADFSRVILTFGYMEKPEHPQGAGCWRASQGLKFDIMKTSFFVGRRTIKPAAKSAMPLWQDKLFIGLARHATNASDFFNIPAGRVVELGTQVTI